MPQSSPTDEDVTVERVHFNFPIELQIDKGIAVLGKRGSGKTELVKWLVRMFASRGYRLIVLDVIGNLKSVKDEYPKQVEYVDINPKDFEAVEGIFKSLLDKGKEKKRLPLMVVMDEADRYSYGMITKTYLSDYINKGRNYGMGYLAVTRRLADFHKDFPTQADFAFVFALKGAREQDSLENWFGLTEEQTAAISELPLHHFAVWGGDNGELLIPDAELEL